MEQIQELENKIKGLAYIYTKWILKLQYEVLNNLFNDFTKKWIYFTLKKTNRGNEERQKYFFNWEDYHFETTFWKIGIKNRTTPISFDFRPDWTFRLASTIEINKVDFKNFEENILKKIHEEIPDFKLQPKNSDNLITYMTNKISDFSLIYKYFNIIDNILKNIDWVKRVDKESFLERLENIIDNVIENNKLLYIDIDYNNKKENKIMPTQDKTSKLLDSKKQIILYWPPWTGKTYNIENIIENHSWESYNDLKNYERVEFITFHQSFSYEEFIEWIKPDLDSDSEEISYKIESGIFKKIVNKAKQKEIFTDNFEKVYENFIKDIGSTLVLETLVKSKEFSISQNRNWNIKVQGKTEHSWVVKKDVLEHYMKTWEAVDWYPYVRAIWKYLVDNYWYQKSWEKEEIKNYYLIIDEINRWNISKIFWELITLLESDKRLWEENEVITKLPYSKEDFWIPSNLFIVATMNTSDKSIVSLDTALRRRFWFKEMLPDYSLDWLNKDIEWINLSKLLQKINNRIEYLIDKDHLIWHSYFLKTNNISDLKLVIYNEILPLLEEYFYWEEEKIRLVLWSKLFEKKNFDDKLFENKGDFENDDNQYEINENLSNEDFINALKNIIKSNEEN